MVSAAIVSHRFASAAIATVLGDGTPVQHVEAYFGLGTISSRTGLLPTREGYDIGDVDVLEQAFA